MLDTSMALPNLRYWPRQLKPSQPFAGQYDRDLTDVYYNTEYVNEISSFKNRSLMGFEQEDCTLVSPSVPTTIPY